MPAASAAHCLAASHGPGRLEASQQQRRCLAPVLTGWGRQLLPLRGLQHRRHRREARRSDLWGSLGSSREGGGAEWVGQRSALLRSRARPSTARLSRGLLQVRRGDTWVKHHVPVASSVHFSIPAEPSGRFDAIVAVLHATLHQNPCLQVSEHVRTCSAMEQSSFSPSPF